MFNKTAINFRRVSVSVIAVLLGITMIFVGLPNTEVQAASGNIPGVPKHVMVGYWHNFFNGTTRTRLKDCPAEWNVINLSFGEPSDRKGLVEFKPYSDLYSSDAEFIEEVEICHAKGQKLVLSIGGQNGVCTLSTTADRDNFVRAYTEIIDRYHLDGLDIDFEGHSISLSSGDNNLKHPKSPSVVNLIDALNTICDHYGDKFILTMAPETLLCHNGCAFYGGEGDSRNGVYLPVIDALRDKLSWLQVQYYNVASLYTPEGLITNVGTAEFNVHAMDMMLEGFYIGNFFAGLPGSLPQDEDHYFKGLRPDQIVMGVPSGTGAAGAGVMTPQEYIEAMEFMRNGGTASSKAGSYTVKNPSKDFRGIMTWSINWDEFHNHNFSSVTYPYIAKINAEDTPQLPITVDEISASKTVSMSQNTDITWTANASGGNGGVLQYQFELFKDGSSIANSGFTSSNKFTYTPKDEGVYYVNVTAKDTSGKTGSKESERITVVNGVSIDSITVAPSLKITEGTEMVVTANTVGAVGAVQYRFDVYKDNQLISAGASTDSNVFRYTPTAYGTYFVKVTAKDSKVTAVNDSAEITVAQKLTVSVTADKNGTVPAGSTVTFTAKVSGGEGQKQFVYYIVKDGKVFYKGRLSTSPTCKYIPLEVGTYTVLTYAKDDAGMSSTQTILTVA